jgi:cellulose synthase/poly-beta-1,6-N-acetylglucosamine synthase-like glycosyltransferase
LLDADWQPQGDALERTMEVLEADERIAFVQTKRLAVPQRLNRFQRYVAINDEGCYHVDFQGRQVLEHPILFSGCCTLLRMDAVTIVGGFVPGHLTEDLDLTDRLWLKGWKGVYLNDVVNYGEVPFTFDHFRRQQERWATGSARCFRRFFWPIVRSKELSTIHKLSAIRQNAYFTSSVLTTCALAVGIATVLWLNLGWNTYQVEFYLYLAESVRIPFMILIYGCVLSNFVEPLVTILVKKRDWLDLLHLPMAVWYAWSLLHTYVLGNVKGLLGRHVDWFRTPKVPRLQVKKFSPSPAPIRLVNLLTLIVLISLYFTEGWSFAWKDYFALLWVPAFMLAAVR